MYLIYAVANLPQQAYDYLISSAAIGITNMSLTINSAWLKDIYVNIPVNNYTKYLFKNLIGESKSLKEIFDSVRAEIGNEIDDNLLLQETRTIFDPFISIGAMLLKDKEYTLTSA